MVTLNLRRQHTEIQAVVDAIVPLLKPHAIDRQVADELRKLLSSLSAKVNAHLVSEDRVLYPRLMNSKVGDTSAVATRLSLQTGSLGKGFKEFISHYPNAEAIIKDPEKFSRETRIVLTALTRRIELEESDLYPMADAQRPLR